jgi:hypothetical protein
MTPTPQTAFGDGNGNCWAACLASMLDMPIEAVPNFCKESDDWWSVTQSWLRDHGYYAIEMILNGDGPWLMPLPEIGCIITGKSPRGDFLHCVVGRIKGDSIVYEFDPHPDQSNIESPQRVCFLVPLTRLGLEVAS